MGYHRADAGRDEVVTSYCGHEFGNDICGALMDLNVELVTHVKSVLGLCWQAWSELQGRLKQACK